MKKTITLIALIFVKSFCYGQLPKWNWAKNIVTSTGNLSEATNCVSSDNNGNVIIAGSFLSSTVTIEGTNLSNTSNAGGNNDAYIAKYSSIGNLIWTVPISGNLSESPTSIICDKEGNTYLTGCFSSATLNASTKSISNSGSDDVFLIKVSSIGNVDWISKIGGVGNEKSHSIAINSKNQILVAGVFTSTSLNVGSTTLSNQGLSDIFISKFDANGNAIFGKSFGGTSLEDCYGITSDLANNIIITGRFYSPSISLGTSSITNTGNASMFVIKLDSLGNTVWSDKWSGSNTNYGIGVTTDSKNNIIVLAHFGDLSMTFGGTLTVTSQYDNHTIIKYAPNGVPIWAKLHADAKIDGKVIQTDNADNIIVLGDFICPTILWGSFILQRNNNAGRTMALTQYDSLGTPLKAMQAVGSWDEYSRGMSLDKKGGLFIVGNTLSDSLKFGNNILYKTGLGQSRSFVACASLDSGLVALSITNILNNPIDLKVYPNPTFQNITIEINEPTSYFDLTISDLLGKIVYRKMKIQGIVNLDLSNLLIGQYNLTINNNNKSISTKIIKLE